MNFWCYIIKPTGNDINRIVVMEIFYGTLYNEGGVL